MTTTSMNNVKIYVPKEPRVCEPESSMDQIEQLKGAYLYECEERTEPLQEEIKAERRELTDGELEQASGGQMDITIFDVVNPDTGLVKDNEDLESSLVLFWIF